MVSVIQVQGIRWFCGRWEAEGSQHAWEIDRWGCMYWTRGSMREERICREHGFRCVTQIRCHCEYQSLIEICMLYVRYFYMSLLSASGCHLWHCCSARPLAIIVRAQCDVHLWRNAHNSICWYCCIILVIFGAVAQLSRAALWSCDDNVSRAYIVCTCTCISSINYIYWWGISSRWDLNTPDVSMTAIVMQLILHR